MQKISQKIFVLLAAVFGSLILFHSSSAHAWDAGHIIDNSVFTNANAMSATDIQNFLNSKVPVCDRNHAPDPTWSQGAQPPWTCLKDYVENPSTHANNLNNQAAPAGGLSAAQIIYNAAQTYSINPQVLLVTMQKESASPGLEMDTWPYPWQYKTPMGFGCPDGAPCDAQWFGFYNQVTQAARHFHCYYQASEGTPCSGFFTPFVKGTSFIAYNPNSSCGGTNVNIVNGATAALYSYTPYQPNAAAIAAGFGSGDGCSSYGNRNFYNYFNSWFGPSVLPTYAWEYVDQSSDRDLSTLPAGEKAVLTVHAKNTGTIPWHNYGSNPVRIATSNPNGRDSQFRSSSWITQVAAGTSSESTVNPGEVGTFQFVIQAPSTPGSYNEYFNLVAENATWLNDPGQFFPITVVDSSPSGLVLQITKSADPISTGDSSTVTIKVKNNGDVTWYNESKFPVKIATYNPTDRSSPFQNSSWSAPTRPAVMSEGRVKPGETGTFTFSEHAPQTPGDYTEAYSLLAEGYKWFNQEIDVPIKVMGTYTWSFVSQGSYTDSTKTTSLDTTALSPSQTGWLVVKAKNTGTATWTNSGSTPVRLGADRPTDRGSRFAANDWIGPNRPATLSEATVAPGQTGTFEFPFKVPPGAGSFKEYFNPLAEGWRWMNNDVGQFFPMNVTSNYSWSFVSQGSYTDSSKTTPLNLSSLSSGQTGWLVVKAKNTGQSTWFNNGDFPTRLGTDRAQDRQSRFSTNAWIAPHRPTALHENSVSPGQTGTFEFPFTVPAGTGTWREYFNPLIEGYTWLNNDVGQFFPFTVH